MRRNHLDEQTTERLLRGELGAEDLPPAYGPVSGLLAAAATVTPIDEEQEAGTVAAMRAAVLGRPVPVPEPGGSRPMLSKLLSAKAAGIAVVAVLGAGTAAAATGSLPGPVQNATSHALSHVDISLPTTPPASPGKSAAAHSHDHGNSSPNAADNGNGPNAHAEFGLCNAESHNDGHPNANADVFPPSTTCTTVTHPGNSSSTTEGTEPAETTETSEPAETTETSEPAQGQNDEHGSPEGPTSTTSTTSDTGTSTPHGVSGNTPAGTRH